MVRANFCQIHWGSHIGGQIIGFLQNLRLKYRWISYGIYQDLRFTLSWTFAAWVTLWKNLPDPSCRKVGTFGLIEKTDWLIWVHTRTSQKCLIFCVRVPFRCKKLFPRILISQLRLLLEGEAALQWSVEKYGSIQGTVRSVSYFVSGFLSGEKNFFFL